MSSLDESKPCRHAWRGGRARAWGLLFLLLAGAGAGSSRAAVLQDYFTNRETITATSGQINGDNTTATVEPGEPKTGGKTGGHSMWISWIAPTNGVATFKTEGSSFDTLLSAYYFASTNDTTFDKLLEAARADDSEGLERESEVDFGVLAGQRYEIAVDGYFGATGPIQLEWNFQPTPFAPPTVLGTTSDRSANIGDSVTLTVLLTNAGSAQFKWIFNNTELGVTTTNLFIPSMQVSNVGRYKLNINVGGVEYSAVPTELQINTESSIDTLAQGKLLDSPGTPLIGQGSGALIARFGLTGSIAFGLGSGVVRGYTGSQIFNTTYATVDTNEPPHCGISNGASYWLIYQPPTNGTITLDTIGSTYDNAMEAYTWNGTLTGYQDLISIACDHDGAGTTNASRVQFPVLSSRQYVVVVEGVNNARGTAYLNYSLNTNQQPAPPILLSQPGTVAVAQGAPATLLAAVGGCPPLSFSWKKNATPMPGLTAAGIFFPSTTTNDTADYVLTVTNDLGSVAATLPLHVLVPPSCSLTSSSNSLCLSFPTVSGLRYTIEEAVAVTGPWQPWPNSYFGDGQPLLLYLPGDGTKFFRVHVE